jgi:hypothetical protein
VSSIAQRRSLSLSLRRSEEALLATSVDAAEYGDDPSHGEEHAPSSAKGAESL